MRSDAAESRLRLVRAVRDVVGEQGTSDVSVRQITAKAGVSTATLYRHFATKDALIDEVSVHRWSQLNGFVSRKLPDDSLCQALRILESFTRMVSADDQFIHAAGLKIGESPAVIAPLRKTFEPNFAELWADAQRQNLIRKSADPRDAMQMAGYIRDGERRLPRFAMLAAGICTEQVNVDSLIDEMFRRRN